MKPVISLSFLLLFAICAVCQQCPKYVCNSELPTGTCLLKREQWGSLIFELNQCELGQVCDIYDMDLEAKCSSNYSHPLKYPGEVCTVDSECTSSVCNNSTKICTGRREKEACQTDIDCHAGMYCSPAPAKICLQTRKEGEKCSLHERCAPYLVCSRGECVLQASLENGADADVPAACKSFFINNGKCSAGPSLKRLPDDPTEGPIPCHDNRCVYISAVGQTEFSEPCQCGHLESGEPLCAPGVGDFSFEDYSEFIERQKLQDTECHVLKGPFCRSRPTNKLGRFYHNAYVVYENYTRGVIYANNSDCVKDVLYPEYWYSVAHVKKIEKVDQPYTFLAATVGIVVILDAIFIWQYFKKWSEDAELIDKDK